LTPGHGLGENGAVEATRIIAIRHGETAWNADSRIQGQRDVGLNDTGRWQARRVGAALADEEITAVYSSDLGRAHETAEQISVRTGIPVVRSEGLRERRFGMFEGKTFNEIREHWPDHAHSWRSRIPEWQPPEGGESLVELRERVHRTMVDLAARHPGEQIVVVAHGGVLDALYRIATGQEVNSPRTWELPNGAINRLLWTPEGFTLVGWSDTQHLDEEAEDDATSF
jgi:probable phosphoglycerate mutase